MTLPDDFDALGPEDEDLEEDEDDSEDDEDLEDEETGEHDG